jgi:hypothetical protein
MVAALDTTVRRGAAGRRWWIPASCLAVLALVMALVVWMLTPAAWQRTEVWTTPPGPLTVAPAVNGQTGPCAAVCVRVGGGGRMVAP